MPVHYEPYSTRKPVSPWKRAHRVWDRGNFSEWYATLSARRKRKDEEFLKSIFNEAARVPALYDALKWAEDHDVKFFVDRKTPVGGYAIRGSGIIGIAQTSFLNNLLFRKDSIAEKVDTVVHEIRHIWQDYHGMLPYRTYNPAHNIISRALVEADARAHGRIAQAQYRLANQTDAAPGPSTKQFFKDQFQSTINNPDLLWNHFKKWFPESAQGYSRRAMDSFSAYFDVTNKKLPKVIYEYNYVASKPPSTSTGLRWEQWSELRRLGKSFGGKNYFDSANRDLFCKEFCASANALNFFGYANKDDIRLVQQVRKNFLRYQLDQKLK